VHCFQRSPKPRKKKTKEKDESEQEEEKEEKKENKSKKKKDKKKKDESEKEEDKEEKKENKSKKKKDEYTPYSSFKELCTRLAGSYGIYSQRSQELRMSLLRLVEAIISQGFYDMPKNLPFFSNGGALFISKLDKGSAYNALKYFNSLSDRLKAPPEINDTSYAPYFDLKSQLEKVSKGAATPKTPAIEKPEQEEEALERVKKKLEFRSLDESKSESSKGSKSAGKSKKAADEKVAADEAKKSESGDLIDRRLKKKRKTPEKASVAVTEPHKGGKEKTSIATLEEGKVTEKEIEKTSIAVMESERVGEEPLPKKAKRQSRVQSLYEEEPEHEKSASDDEALEPALNVKKRKSPEQSPDKLEEESEPEEKRQKKEQK